MACVCLICTVASAPTMLAHLPYSFPLLQGVPVRVELGPRDVEKREFVCVTRDIGKKETFPWEGVGPRIKAILKDMHQRMLDR